MTKNYWSAKALALASGLFWGLYLALAALLEMYKISFWWFQSAHFEILTTTHPGLAATWQGAWIGLAEGFICGVICGLIIAWLYNLSLKLVG